MLFSPRRWVVMPNVLGLTEEYAVRKLHEAGIVPRVTYEDRSDLGIADGTCYMQDVEPGQLWNTDASIFIWVQKDGWEPPPRGIK